MYKRSNELVESAYFNKISNFTHDVDRIYKDLMANDAFTNIRKYSMLCWEFLKEKYFKFVPFGKELNDVFTELVYEIRKLQKLEAFEFIASKIAEVQSKLEWFANELQVEKRAYHLWSIIQNKIAHITETALQTDNKYREAKTKFIFDPDTGVMKLEQKLPMSWHAFNETPRFDEIPEYKKMIELARYFDLSNFTLWSLYYEYLPYTDFGTWLPPYKCKIYADNI